MAMAGLTLATGAVIGMSASTASAATVQDSKSTVAQPRPGGGDHPGGGSGGNGRGGDWRGNDGRFHGGWDGHRNGGWTQSWTVRTFQNKKSCTFAGWIGEQRGAWDDYDCYRVGRGGKYVLVAHEYGGRRHR
ncbi:hypothetical protein ACFPIJ_13510 [Dactylosporangium cerinum]|uniref:Uncharacterized protein n=1 Tax=Dactylosporangium cerinum TaxID=1434730 RepID=A0ABV9VTM9_9ACTN